MIIGLTGTNGAGKGKAAKYLIDKGYSFYSLSDIIREEADLQGMERTRDNLRKLGNDLRETGGPGVLAAKTADKVITKNEKNVVIDSVRTPSEVEELRKLDNFVLIAVDAPITLRYERIQKRKRTEDAVDFDTFKAQEEAEMAGGHGKQEIKTCMELADFSIMNDSSVEELNKKVEEIIQIQAA